MSNSNSKLNGAQILKVKMIDKRWPSKDGWVKLVQNVNGVEIHYLWNRNLNVFDDFKFVR